MNLQQAWEAAVGGENVRQVDLQPGAYIDYNFAGLRINFPNGSSSGYRTKPEDETVEWEIYKKPEGWASFVETPKPVKQGWNDYG